MNVKGASDHGLDPLGQNLVQSHPKEVVSVWIDLSRGSLCWQRENSLRADYSRGSTWEEDEERL